MKVLVLTHRLPYAPDRGDRIRSYHMLRTLARVADVHLFSLREAHERNEVAGLQGWLSSVTTAVPRPLANRLRGVLTLGGSRPLTHTLLDAPGIESTLGGLARQVRPDVVLAYCSGMARFAVDGPLRDMPCVLDMVDVDSAKWAALAGTTPGPMRAIYRREARLLGAFEARACRHAATTLVVNTRERETLRKLAPDASIAVIGNGVDLGFFTPPGPPAESQQVVFCGVMDYQPNVEGVAWFATSVWPLVRRALPDARFTIVGARPVARVKKLAAIDGIEVTGVVDDVRPFLWRSAVAVAPLLTARGLQNKVLEALAAGLPVVATGAVGAGLPACALAGCELADDPDAFAGAIVRLVESAPEVRRAIGRFARLDRLSWDACLAELPPILDAAAQRKTWHHSSPETCIGVPS